MTDHPILPYLPGTDLTHLGTETIIAAPDNNRETLNLPPKPGHTITFTMPLSMSTLKVNRLIMDTTNIILIGPYKGLGAEANKRHEPERTYERPRKTVLAHYVHGFGTDLRDTLVARFTPRTGEVIVHYPPNYHGDSHPSTDDWARARVAIWDAVLFALGGPGGAGGVTKSVT